MRRSALAFAVVVVVCFSAVSLFAQRAEPEFVAEAVGLRRTAPAPRLAEKAAALPAAVLTDALTAEPDEVALVQAWNDAGRRPMRNGFTRRLAEPVHVTLGAAAMKAASGRAVMAMTERGTVVWSGSVRVEGAYRIRLHLTDVRLPESATLWVYGRNEEPIAFGRELLSEGGDLYTPSVGGDVAWLEIEAPLAKENEPASFVIADVVEMLGSKNLRTPAADDAPTCLVDATCITSSTLDVIDLYRRGVAEMIYVKDGGSFVCTGGLINDKDTATSIPYFLTANHCIANQTVASSLEAYWDYRTSTCNGAAPSLSSLQRSSGSTLLATSDTTDFTLLRLNNIPAQRVFLGWDANSSNVRAGTRLHRISHPFPDSDTLPRAQSYTGAVVDGGTGACSSRPRTNYLYSSPNQGGVYGGSSGSPVILAGGYIVGQLFGSCGPDPSAGCDRRNLDVDGAFFMTYDSVKAFIDSSPATPSPCVTSATTMCLNNGRFAVSVAWKDFEGKTGTGTAVRLTSDSGYFWFFGDNNIELMIKVLDARGIGSGFWVFFGALSNVEYTITVRDSQTGRVKTYFNPSGTFGSVGDTGAFPPN